MSSVIVGHVSKSIVLVIKQVIYVFPYLLIRHHQKHWAEDWKLCFETQVDKYLRIPFYTGTIEVKLNSIPPI